ncbi:MAG: hypothetical protein JO010_02360, partial [Alphaproteobacteria bacterium]|nr:hypothetical protein [Alphaproteobacteria bacterium]
MKPSMRADLHLRWRGALSGLRSGARTALREYRFHDRLRPHRRAAEQVCALPVEGRYIFSSERGLYHVSRNALRLLAPIPAFGIARAGNRIYLATWHERESIVLAGSWPALIS